MADVVTVLDSNDFTSPDTKVDSAESIVAQKTSYGWFVTYAWPGRPAVGIQVRIKKSRREPVPLLEASASGEIWETDVLPELNKRLRRASPKKPTE